jgi:RNA polymerase sigma-70 factor (ECF subfamily)
MPQLHRKPTFTELYAEHADDVYRFSYRLCLGNAAEAEDLAQDTFVRAWEGFDAFEGRASMKTWLFRIVLNRRMELQRRDRRVVPLDDSLEETLEAADTGVESIRVRIEQVWLERALGLLSEPLYEALVLVKMEGLTHREVAAITGEPEGTIKWRVAQGLRTMRALLTEEGAFPALVPVSSVERELSAWGSVSAPPSLGPRVRKALEEWRRTLPGGEPGAAPVSEPSASRPQTPRRASAAASRPRLFWKLGLGAVGALAVSTALVAWVHRREETAAPAAQDLFETAARVRTAHATGARVHFLYDRRGAAQTERFLMEDWFKIPGRYRQTRKSTSGFGFPSILTVEGGRGVLTAQAANNVPFALAGEATTVSRTLAPFSFFTGDGHLATLLRQGGVKVTPLRVEQNAQEVTVLAFDAETGSLREHWTVYPDPFTHLPSRVEYQADALSGGSWRPSVRETLDGFQYDSGLPDSLFQLPAVGKPSPPSQ